jgi:hypothetical protein
VLAGIDLLIARIDVFAPLMPATHPTTFYAGLNNHLTRAVRALYPQPEGSRPLVLLGNSMFVDASGPLPLLAEELEQRGAPPATPVLSLCVLASYPTDAEVLSRDLAPVRPSTVLLGIGAPDLGAPLERARTAPVTQMLDTGFRDGPVPPADWSERADRWTRTVWRLYRYRALFRDLLIPPEGTWIPAATLERRLSPAEFFDIFYPPEQAKRLLALRADFERDGSFATFLRYLELLRGPDYVAGVRARWREVQVEALQVDALHRFAAHVRDAGGRPAFVLLPENPLLLHDPDFGDEIRSRSDAVAARVAAEAKALGVPLLDLRHTLPATAFVDLNHLFFNSGAFLPVLADALAGAGLLAPPTAPASHA